MLIEEIRVFFENLVRARQKALEALNRYQADVGRVNNHQAYRFEGQIVMLKNLLASKELWQSSINEFGCRLRREVGPVRSRLEKELRRVSSEEDRYRLEGQIDFLAQVLAFEQATSKLGLGC
jgi:hypothetical protein